ncbi:endonuclease/exonuclease/phosphatase family protein [Dyadobacter luticola]|uniref:Endonuclease n=1 Tax=Dyadobacter luticola TaxID=1979387 RepID=A0A5R9L4I2_9BACT|nr:endonuclease/exonuclease/phosphatase family protein [Dyadobacter luticola]TLV03338.1 endonuclease [Dyadobacter luticola]
MTISSAKNRSRNRGAWLFLMLPLFWAGTDSSDNNLQNAVSGATFVTLDSASSGEFSVITYNVAGLPEIISSAKTQRAPSITEIGHRISRFDIAHIQEDFNYNRNLYNRNTHSFRTRNKGKVPFGDGLNTLSKYPIREMRRVKWNDCTGADCFTPKGFTYSRLEVAKDVFIDFYNVHANAYNHASAAKARRNNILQLSNYIKMHSAGQAVIVMGDLNAHYCFGLDNLKTLLADHHFEDAWIFHKRKGLLPQSSQTIPPADILTITDSTETIDKILYRSSNDLILKTSEYRLENDLFSDAAGLPLSDHHPVSARVQWALRKVEYLTKRLR